MRALDAYPDARFVDVVKSDEMMKEMLELSDGQKRVPVIVEDGKATVGFKGGA